MKATPESYAKKDIMSSLRTLTAGYVFEVSLKPGCIYGLCFWCLNCAASTARILTPKIRTVYNGPGLAFLFA